MAARVRAILARHVGVDPSRLVPADRPMVDLEMEALSRGSGYRFILDLEEAVLWSLREHEILTTDVESEFEQKWTLGERLADRAGARRSTRKD